MSTKQTKDILKILRRDVDVEPNIVDKLHERSHLLDSHFISSIENLDAKATDGDSEEDQEVGTLKNCPFLIFSCEKQLFKRLCPSVRPSVHMLVRRSVRHAFF